MQVLSISNDSNDRCSQNRKLKCSLIAIAALSVLVVLLLVILAVSKTKTKGRNGEDNKKLAPGACIDGWLQGPNDLSNNCYIFLQNPDGLTWKQSDEHCRKLGGLLITIHTASERTFIISRLFQGGGQQGKTERHCYLGLLPNPQRSEWHWIDTLQPFDAAVVNWRAGQPDNYAGIEACSNLWVKEGTDETTVLNDIACEKHTWSNYANWFQIVCKYSL